jgi:hypothetical protein
LPDGRGGRGVFAPNPLAGDCRNDFESGTVTLTSPPINLLATEAEFILTFDHYYATQTDFDGGLLEYARAGEDFRSVPATAFLYNGYDGPLASPRDNDNPLASRPAFHGADQNSTSGSWGRSIVDLNALGLVAGDDFQLRWVFGQDGCDGRLGWFLDDIQIGYCGESALPVSWLRFTAAERKDHVRLDWAVTDEAQNTGFYVTRRAAGDRGFTDLGFVAAGADYQFADWAVAAGGNYAYRLRQIDQDGTATYSPVVVAQLAAAATALRVFPNPVADWLTVVAAPEASSATLFNASGKRVATVSLAGGRGQLQVNNIVPGIYLLRVGEALRRVVISR